MALILWLAGAILSPGDLASDHWHVRDAAESRLKFAGVFAVPFLRPLATSGDLDARRVAARLLARQDAWVADLAAGRKWLAATEPTDAEYRAVYRDPAARYHLSRALSRLKLLSLDEANALTNGATPDVVSLFFGVPDYSECAWVIRAARSRFLDPNSTYDTEG